MTGMFDVEGYTPAAGDVVANAISFPFQLTIPPTAAIEVPWSGTNPDPAHCAGTVDAPAAAPGYLCVYDRAVVNATSGCGGALCIQDLENSYPSTVFGARLVTRNSTAGYSRVEGSWAVTAP